MASEYTNDAEEIASRTMYELLGRRWVWPAVTTTETVEVTPGQRVISLQGRPIIDVESVFVEGTTEPLAHTVENKYRIRLTSAALPYHPALGALSYPTLGGCRGGKRVSVTYSYGARPPLEVEYAIEVLRNELTLGMNEDEECRLPQRITSIQREGISMSVLDSQAFLDDGRTGIEEIDAVLAKFNPAKAKRPARVFGRVTQPPTRTNTH